MIPILSMVLATVVDRNVSLEFGTPVNLGSGKYLAWSLSAIYDPDSYAYQLIVSTSSTIMRSVDGQSWADTGSNATFTLLTALPTPEAPPRNFPLHSFGTTEAAYQGQKVPFKDFFGSKPTYYDIRQGGKFFAVTQDSNLSFTGLPRPIGCIQTTCCNCPFRVLFLSLSASNFCAPTNLNPCRWILATLSGFPTKT